MVYINTFNFQNDPTYGEGIVTSILHMRKMKYRDVRQLTYHYIDPTIDIYLFLCWISSALGSKNKKPGPGLSGWSVGFPVKANKTQLPAWQLGNFQCVAVVSCAGPDGGTGRGWAGMRAEC